jgi:uncharacterized protein (TIGR03086 family)
MTNPDPVELFERAASGATKVIEQVTPEQWSAPTPCTEWDVTAVLEHMLGGADYVLTSVGLEPAARTEVTPDAYRAAVAACLDALRQPGVLERRCQSPAGFEWSVAEAAAGTALDHVVHTWDIAVAIGEDRHLDPVVVEACSAMFLPHVAELGREAGLIGPEVPVPADASAEHRLLGAMGRQP